MRLLGQGEGCRGMRLDTGTPRSWGGGTLLRARPALPPPQPGWLVADNGAPWIEPPRQSLPARGAPGARSAERVAHVTGPANHPEPLIALHVGTSLRTSKERGKS